MTPREVNSSITPIESLLGTDGDFLRPMIQKLVQEALEAEMDEALQAGKSQRDQRRLGYRSGYYPRTLLTRVGRIELRVPQDRNGLFSTEIFDRYQRSEKALVSTLIEMYVQGVSTRKVARITEELCGHRVSASVVSRLNKTLDKELKNFAHRPLQEDYPYLILDARYEKVRDNGVVRSQAVLIALGINWDGRREVLATELDNRESKSSWKGFLLKLKQRGLSGVEFCVTDSHAGLRKAISEVLPEALWQRCYVHFLRNALDYLPRKHDDDCLLELRWLYDRRDINEARRDLIAWVERWGDKYQRLCDWVEQEIDSTLSFYRLPREHHKHLKSTNMLERLNEEIKRRTHIVRTFPNLASALRLIRAITHQTHEVWIDQHRYLNMDHLREAKKLSQQETNNKTAA